MRQLKERITHNFALEPLVRDDVAEYLEFRMRAAGYKGPNVFSPAATKLIYDASKGLTRRVNILADKSLLAAFAEGTHQITAKEVRAAIRDCDFSTATAVEKHSRKRLVAALIALAAGTAALATIITLKTSREPNNQPAAAQVAIPPATATPSAPAATAAPTISAVAVVTTPPPAEAALARKIEAPAAPVAAPAPSKVAASLTEQALDRGRTWLAASPDERWFLQLYAVNAADSAKVEAYLQRLSATENSDAIHAYRSDLSGKLRYGVMLGDYPDRATAIAAIKKLPEWVQANKVYPRQVKRLR